MGSRVVALISIGLSFLIFGLYYKFNDDIINRYFQSFILFNKYFYASDLVWDALPYLFVIVAIICFIAAGASGKSTTKVVYE